jgi:hypothetical protein
MYASFGGKPKMQRVENVVFLSALGSASVREERRWPGLGLVIALGASFGLWVGIIAVGRVLVSHF